MTTMLARALELLPEEDPPPSKREAVFFSEHVDAAISGKSPDEALDALRKLIDEATIAKEFGSGPPMDELNRARRKWNDIYARHYGRAA